jgi:hypothetical protein
MWFRSKKGDFIIISSAITTVVYGRGQHPPARAGASRRFSSKSATNSGSELLRVLRPGSDGPRGDFPHRPCLPVVAGGGINLGKSRAGLRLMFAEKRRSLGYGRPAHRRGGHIIEASYFSISFSVRLSQHPFDHRVDPDADLHPSSSPSIRL